MFPQDKFYAQLKGYVEARLHTDTHQKFKELQKKFGTLALPLFVVEDPFHREKPLLTHTLELVDQKNKVLAFLKQGLALWKVRQAKK